MAKANPQVLDGDQKVPFLRGMITHSLLARGLSFQDAYKTAQVVRDRLGAGQVVDKAELAALIRKVVQERFGDRVDLNAKLAAAMSPVVIVKGSDSDVPFSKGMLSQSLQAAGLEPSVGFDIARNIETDLLKEKRTEVTRTELRRRIYETILDFLEPAYGERYLLWRLLQNSEKPLILLFGGATGTGKSSVAAEVAHRLGIQQVMSTDSIRQIMRLMFSKDLLPVIHLSSYAAWTGVPDLEDLGSRAVLDAFREQATRVLVGVRATIERALQERFSLILEGVHLVPGLFSIKEFQRKAHIVTVVVSTLNRKAHLQRFSIREGETERPADHYRSHFKEISRIQDYILEMAENHDTSIIENQDLERTVLKVLSVIANTVRDELGISSGELLNRALER